METVNFSLHLLCRVRTNILLGLDDLVYVGNKTDLLATAINLGKGSFSAFQYYGTYIECLTRGVRFGDWDGDGTYFKPSDNLVLYPMY